MELAQKHEKIRQEFPQLHGDGEAQPVIYFDSAATSLKPRSVIKRIEKLNSFEVANVHRGAHRLASRLTTEFEEVRKEVASFIGAESENEIVFVRGTTEGLNFLAHSITEKLKPQDEVLVSDLEHHANYVPWQTQCLKRGLVFKHFSLNADLDFSLEELKNKITAKTKVLALTHASNHTGGVQDLKPIIELAKRYGIWVVVDGAQFIGKRPLNVKDLGADFYVFSGHKMFAPFGVGVVYGQFDLLNALEPFQTGGSMIQSVSFEKSTWNICPFKFEAGTPSVDAVIGLGEAIRFISKIGFSDILAIEEELCLAVDEHLLSLDFLKRVGNPQDRLPLISFNLDSCHHADVAALLDEMNFAVRAGHHCTQPLLNSLKEIKGSVRASFSIYNTTEEIVALRRALIKVKDMLT